MAQDPAPQDPQDPQAPEEAVDENLLLAKPVIATEETTGSLGTPTVPVCWSN